MSFQQVDVALSCYTNLTVETKDLQKKYQYNIVLFIMEKRINSEV